MLGIRAPTYPPRTATDARARSTSRTSGLVVIVHAAVPGRVRCRVQGLYGNRRLRITIEQTLTAVPGIERVTASDLTGRVLVLYAPSLNTRAVARLIEHALAAAVAAPRRHAVSPHLSDEVGRRSIIPSALRRVKRRSRQPEASWHAIARDEALRILRTSREGLLPDEARARLRAYGPNAIARPPARSDWRILLQQFESLPVALLGAAAVLSLATGAIADALVVLAVVGVNAAVGYFTESGAERTVRSVSIASRRTALVRRGGSDATIDAESVVPGDVLLLRQGTVVPADARLLECDHLTVDESTLTGESAPVSKQSAPGSEDVPLADRSCMVYRETVVSGGQGLAIVVGTGSHTEIGRLQNLVDTLESGASPLRIQLELLGRRLTIAGALACAGVFVVGVMRGIPALQMLKTAISLAVSAIPEGLPAVATTTLALGLGRLRSNGVVIRELTALETLGAMQTLCLDKTGTITENRMTVVSAYAAGRRMNRLERAAARLRERGTPLPRGIRALLRLCALCTEARPADDGSGQFKGSSTEVALVDAAQAAGIDAARLQRDRPVEWTLHRSEGHNVMCTVHGRRGRPPRRWLVVIKGSPGEVLASCTRQVTGYHTPRLDDVNRRRILNVNNGMSGEALRVLGVAYTYVEDEHVRAIPRALTWVGLIAMSDCVREGAGQLVHRLHDAGVRTVMITGDQPATAAAIARSIGLHRGGDLVTVSAADVESASPGRLGQIAASAHVFARVSPAQKLKIVHALQGAGLVVGMTGDGVNDGPALKAANLGIAMGAEATDVARELATVIVLDDRLDRLAMAVQEGRAVFQNVQRSVHFLVATNLSEMAVIATGVAAGANEIMTPRQLLWINLISDLWPSLALALEPGTADVMRRPPRDPRTPIVGDRALVTLAGQGGVLGAGSLAAYACAALRHSAGPRAGTVGFLALTTGQLLHAYNVRSTSGCAGRNRQLDTSVLTSLALQACAIALPPLRRLMGLTSIDVIDGGIAAAGALLATLISGRAQPLSLTSRPLPT